MENKTIYSIRLKGSNKVTSFATAREGNRFVKNMIQAGFPSMLFEYSIVKLVKGPFPEASHSQVIGEDVLSFLGRIPTYADKK